MARALEIPTYRLFPSDTLAVKPNIPSFGAPSRPINKNKSARIDLSPSYSPKWMIRTVALLFYMAQKWRNGLRRALLFFQALAPREAYTNRKYAERKWAASIATVSYGPVPKASRPPVKELFRVSLIEDVPFRYGGKFE